MAKKQNKNVYECGHCHTKIYVGETFCSECGEPVYKTCTCGKEVYAGEKFCPHCGAEIFTRARTRDDSKKIGALDMMTNGSAGMMWYPGFGLLPASAVEEPTFVEPAERTRPAPADYPFGDASLICAILSFFLPMFILSILAIAFGAKGVGREVQIKRSKAGIVLGVITLILTIVLVALVIVFYQQFIEFLGTL